ARLRLLPAAARLACLPRRGRARMSRLVDGDARAARKRNLRHDPPPDIVRLRARDVPLAHCRDEAGDVGAHQMEIGPWPTFRLVDAELRRREAEDLVPPAGVDSRESEHVAEKRPTGVRIRAAN